jgi:glycosyltransferase involved in cell wall biosynthesis
VALFCEDLVKGWILDDPVGTTRSFQRVVLSLSDDMTFPKKVLLINQYFYPDMAATSQLLGDLARWLCSKGWEVVTIAGRGSYANGGKANGCGSVRVWNGVSVRRVWCTDFGRGNLAGRLCDYITFLISAASAVAIASKPDVVVCLSTPPFVAVLGLIARMKGSHLVYKVEDLYPDIAVALSTLSEKSLLTRLLSRLSRFLLRKADWVVALDEAMRERLQTAGARCVETITNWADGTAIRPDAQARKTFRQSQDLKGKFVVLYSGNLGLAHRFDSVMEAAKQCLVELPDVLFLFVGNGARLKEVQEAAKGLDNVRFMDYQARETLNELYNAADVHLVTLRDEVSGLLFPSKYPAALAAGKPVLLVGGRGAPFEREIQSKGLGWTCPHQASAVMDVLRDALQNPENLGAMGKAARQVFELRYSTTVVMQRWEHVLNSVLKGNAESGEAAVFDKKKAVSTRSV